ncbi:MAG: SpoIVB peptidase [Ruminococcaceae bacterium]|nr:SpoIVB peptidase [Oscillospiraceae bacterium]
MKIVKKFLFGIYFCLISLTVVLFLQIGFYTISLPDNFYREENSLDSFGLAAYPAVTVKNTAIESVAVSAGVKKSYEMTLMLYGIIPIKNVTVRQAETPILMPSGEAFGLKMMTDGVMVTDYGSVEGENCFRSPAKEGGILAGDVIISVNGVKTETAGQLSEAVQKNQSKTEIVLLRGEEKITVYLTPERSVNDGIYKLGIWTRDSCAGIGTLTYYDRKNCSYGGLGHSVCDADTGALLPLSYGETVPVCVNSVVKGVNGRPGELCGTFMSASANGSILLNTDCGVFGYSAGIPEKRELPMAFKQEIEIGKASILTTLNGMTPESYDIVIEKVDYNSSSAVKNMIIRIDDEELLQKTGGIVQGMSGSPIIQNGKLVGAVTHVFVNDISRGYAVFAENMYEISSKLKAENDYDFAA